LPLDLTEQHVIQDVKSVCEDSEYTYTVDFDFESVADSCS